MSSINPLHSLVPFPSTEIGKPIQNLPDPLNFIFKELLPNIAARLSVFHLPSLVVVCKEMYCSFRENTELQRRIVSAYNRMTTFAADLITFQNRSVPSVAVFESFNLGIKDIELDVLNKIINKAKNAKSIPFDRVDSLLLKIIEIEMKFDIDQARQTAQCIPINSIVRAHAYTLIINQQYANPAQTAQDFVWVENSGLEQQALMCSFRLRGTISPNVIIKKLIEYTQWACINDSNYVLYCRAIAAVVQGLAQSAVKTQDLARFSALMNDAHDCVKNHFNVQDAANYVICYRVEALCAIARTHLQKRDMIAVAQYLSEAEAAIQNTQCSFHKPYALTLLLEVISLYDCEKAKKIFGEVCNLKKTASKDLEDDHSSITQFVKILLRKDFIEWEEIFTQLANQFGALSSLK